MQHISAPYLFVAASKLDRLLDLPTADTPIEDLATVLNNAYQQMIDLHAPGSLYGAATRSAILAGEATAKLLKTQTDDLKMGRVVPASALWAIKTSYEQYRAALLAAFSAMGVFLVDQKGSHDAYTLLFEGEKLFPVDLPDKVPEAKFDAQQAGKCLAYNVATACGFHTFRVLESVVRRYWTLTTGGKAHPKVRSLGVYVRAFKEAKAGDPKVIAALEQIKELHRNPLIHPEAALETEEALSILGLTRSAVSAMLVHLPVLLATTTAVPRP